MLYFAQAEGIGRIKIGFTDGDVSARLADLQTGSPVPIRLLGTLAGTLEDEKDLHRRFGAARVCGEWFEPTPELLALIPSAEPLVCGKVEVVERSVSIRVMTVGRKQFTKSLLEQLPRAELICWPAVWDFLGNDVTGPQFDLCLAGVFWGWVQGELIDLGGGSKERRYWLIFESEEGVLCKQSCMNWIPDKALPKPSTEQLRNRIGQVWADCRERLLSPENQLFIGV